MKRNLFILYITILLLGCEKNEQIIPRYDNSQLIINWQHQSYGNSSFKENAMVYLYENENDYKNPIAKAAYSQSLADLFPNGGVIKSENSATFDNLKPIKYWIKIFNAYNHEGMVEHNQNYSFTLQNPLIENTLTTVTIPTQRVYINSYTIKKIEIFDIPDWINSNIGDKVELKIYESFPSGYAGEDRILDSKELTISDNFITYEPTNITINKFNSWWWHPRYFIILNNIGSSDKKISEINIFQLLNSNAFWGEEYIKLNSNNEIEYKLYVSWNTK